MRLSVDPQSLDGSAAEVFRATGSADLAPALRLLREMWTAMPGSGLGLITDSLAEQLGRADQSMTAAGDHLARAYSIGADAYRAADTFGSGAH